MSKIVKETIISSDVKSIHIKPTDIKPDLTFDQRMKLHREIEERNSKSEKTEESKSG